MHAFEKQKYIDWVKVTQEVTIRVGKQILEKFTVIIFIGILPNGERKIFKEIIKPRKQTFWQTIYHLITRS